MEIILASGSPRRELPLLLISGVAMGINWILLFEAYRYTTVSVAPPFRSCIQVSVYSPSSSL